MKITHLTIALACSLAFTSCDKKKVQNETSAPLQAAGTELPAQAQAAEIYRLQSGDKISMQMAKEPSMTTEAEIGKSGSLVFPLIGLVTVKGLSVPELEQKLMGLYRGKHYVDPKISIVIQGYAIRFVRVSGAVLNPGAVPYPEKGAISLAQAVAYAGGILETGNDQKITLSRKKGGADVYSLAAGAKIKLFPGDTVVVPRLPVDKRGKDHDGHDNR